jgi:hypothetical protein
LPDKIHEIEVQVPPLEFDNSQGFFSFPFLQIGADGSRAWLNHNLTGIFFFAKNRFTSPMV